MTESKKLDPLAMIDALAKEERRLSESKFVAPVSSGGLVRLRVKGIVHELRVDDAFEGWAILCVTSPGKARVQEPASPAIVSEYLKLFPRLRVVLLQQFDKCWWALGDSSADTRFRFDGPVPIHLVTGGRKFDTVYCRFDGSTFWFESVDRRRDPSIARLLNQALKDQVAPDDVRCPGAVPQEKLAYKMLWLSEGNDPFVEGSDESRISRALKHAGAELEELWNLDNNQLRIRFADGGRTRYVIVRSDDLGVVSSGICLSGMDRDFDLASLVGVLRESEYDND